MKDDACEVMSRGIQVEPLIIKRMRHPGQRMPVCFISREDRPFDRAPREPGLEMRVFCDIAVVIEVDELKMCCLVINGKCENDE